LLEKFIRFFAEKNLRTEGHKFLVAVSGGVDSVVLCALCKQAGLDFTIAHANFGLRGEESERDEAFVRSLGKRYGVEVCVKKFDMEAEASRNKQSIQETARDLRYKWFSQVRSEKGLDYILVAHHAGDNIETLMMNFFRGTGLQGMTGIPEWNPEARILRPMIHAAREEIEDYAREQGLQWMEDSSNSSSKYTRNFFRNELIPAIKKIYPQVAENLLDNIERFKKINALYHLSLLELKKKICEQKGTEVRIPFRKLMRYRDTSLIYEIIREYGFGEKQVDEVIKLAGAGSGKFIANEQFRIIKHGNWFIIVPRLANAETILIEEPEQEVRFHGGRMRFKTMMKDAFQLQRSDALAQLDARHIEFPLLLRKWKQGDYFYPLGMRKKKKVSRFFIDRKLAKHLKEDAWVMESGRKIIWVVGMRIDDRFRITDATEQILVITLDR
jgi:tRNA(Ile)-lysidine synthase